MEVSGQFQALAVLSPENFSPIFIVYEAGWAPDPVWRLWRRANSYSAENRTPAIAIPTELSRLLASEQEEAAVPRFWE
jgi:hypothetical protein